jgi:ABC-type Zn uptake system ZnuABC Zn-binding protein ZnuA
MTRALLGLVGLVALFAASCGGSDGDNERPLVVATNVQIAAIAEALGGDLVNVRSIVPSGADAHEFEPVASDLRAIEEADIILRHGVGLDDWLDDTLAAGEGAHVVVVTDRIDLLRPALERDEHAEEVSGDGDHDDEDLDPHVWHDPERVQIMAENVMSALADVDPGNSQAYADNLRAYESRLDDAKAEAAAIIAEIPAEDRKLVTNHDAFGYFADAFGLTIVGAVIPSTTTAAEPSAEDTAALLDLIEREDVKAIFAESSVNPALARTLAEDAGVVIVDDLYGDSLGEDDSGADTIEGMLVANARKIAEALK